MKNSGNKIVWYLTCLSCLLSLPVKGQNIKTTTGNISFSVSAPAKTIKGESKTASVVINLKSGAVSVTVPVKSFAFSNNFVSDTLNTLIRERFNHYYLESDRFPDIGFQGKITLPGKTKTTEQLVFNGKLTLHGVTRDVEGTAVFTISNGRYAVKALLKVIPAEYNIRIPPYIGYMYFKEVNIELTTYPE